jgi:hypothetical protein
VLGLCIVQDNPIDNIRKPLYQWEYIILNFLPDKLYLLNFEQVPGHWYDNPFPVKNSINLITSLDQISEELVILDFNGEILLNNFSHPETCTYVFGPNNGTDFKNSYNFSNAVKIESKSSWEYYSWVAAGITLHDRYIKNGN